MSDSPKKGEALSQISSGTVQPGRLIADLILNDETGKTAFAVSRTGTISTEGSVDDIDGTRLLPIPETNNLIRHNVLSLPEQPHDFGSVAQLMDDIHAYIQRYLDLSPDFNAVASAYVLFSWVYDAFNELPYLRFRGDFGSGKTRALTILGSICYKSFFASGASTVSPIFHTLDTFRGTLVLDEADFRFSDKDADIVKILNNGNVRGFPVLRQSINLRREFDPRAFTVFGPKIVAMRESFIDPALESRFLTEDMGQRSANPSVPINLPASQKVEAMSLRNRLLMYRLRHWTDIRIDPTLSDTRRSNRVSQILIPLLSTVGDPEMRNAIERVADKIEHELRIDRLLTPEAGVIDVLAEMMRDSDRASTAISDVAAALSKKYGNDFERIITPRYVGQIVRKRLHLATYKTHGVYVVPATERDKILILAERYGVLNAR